MLKNVLREEGIKVNIEVENWEQAISEAGKLLLDIGGIQPSYIDKMIETVKKFGPYIVIAPGIALAHARSGDGVNFTCFSVATLKNPINFGNKNNDPVKLVIALASIDHDAHVQGLRELVEVISDNKKYQAIINATQKQEVLDNLMDKLN